MSYVVALNFGIRNPFNADCLQSRRNTIRDVIGELAVVRRTAAQKAKEYQQLMLLIRTSCRPVPPNRGVTHRRVRRQQLNRRTAVGLPR